MAALIVYGSLYPWQFAIPAGGVNPLAALFQYFPPRSFNLYVLRDVAVNIAIYVPFGAAAYLALPPDANRFLRVLLPTLFGFLLSLAIEIAQGFTPMRNGNMLDVLMNAAGSVIGAALAAGLLRSSWTQTAARGGRRHDTASLALLWCWIASLLFPFFPVAGRTELFAKLRELARPAHLDALSVASHAISWYVAGRLLQSSGVRRPSATLVWSLLALPLQLLIVTRQPDVGLAVGSCAGIFAFVVLPGIGPRALAAVLLVLLAMRGLSPFEWQSTAKHFTWVPFGGPLEIDWQAGVRILLEKTVLYGMAVWGLRQAGLSWMRATIVISILLAGLELVQTHLVGRTAEITDPIVALLMGVVLASLSVKPRRVA